MNLWPVKHFFPHFLAGSVLIRKLFEFLYKLPPFSSWPLSRSRKGFSANQFFPHSFHIYITCNGQDMYSRAAYLVVYCASWCCQQSACKCTGPLKMRTHARDLSSDWWGWNIFLPYSREHKHVLLFKKSEILLFKVSIT